MTELATISDLNILTPGKIQIHSAIQTAKPLIPSIKKNKQVAFGKTQYSYPELPEVLSVVSPVLVHHEILYITETVIFDQPQIIDNIIFFGKLITKLIHVPTSELVTSADPLAVRIKSTSYDFTSKQEKVSENNIMQGYGSAKTFAQRYGLLTILGLSPEMDDDAYSSFMTKITDPSSEEHIEIIMEDKLKQLSNNPTNSDRSEDPNPIFMLWEMKKKAANQQNPDRAKKIQSAIDGGRFLENPNYEKMVEWIKGL